MKKLFILFVAVAMVAAFTVPAMAEAEWNFYGSARFATFYTDDDPDTAGVDSDKETQWEQQGNSRIGATVKFNDEIGGAFEMSDSFGKRKLYGTYNFGAGQLLIGQTYTPVDFFYSSSVMNGDGGLLNIGQFYEGRQPMIQLKFPFGLKFAAVTPTGTTVAGYDTDILIPKLELSYSFKTDVFFIDVFGGYQTIDLESPAGDESIDATVYGMGAGANIGPVYFKFGVHAGTNVGNFAGLWDQVGGRNMSATIVGGDVEDNDNLGYCAVVGFKAGDVATIELGYGYEEYDSNLAGEQADETTQMYVNATINITKGFFLVPEIGLYDRSESEVAGVEEGDIFYIGLKWQINF